MSENPTDAGPEQHKLRGLADIQRPADDKMVAGVCAGLARYLNIDPVIVRIGVVALSFVGLAGVILYVAGWLMFPVEGESRSIAARGLRLNENEEQIRIVVLIAAIILAISAGSGVIGGNSGLPFSWAGLIILGAGYLWIIRPAQRRNERRRAAQPAHPASPAGSAAGPDISGNDVVVDPTLAEPTNDTEVTHVLPTPGAGAATEPIAEAEPKTPWSPALTFITLSSALIAIGCLALWEDTQGSLPWTAYLVTALGVIGLGLLIGGWWGNGGALIPIGGLLAIVLAVSTLLPSARIGHDIVPADPGAVSAAYKLGVGQLELNLDDVDDPATLEGRTITVKVGIGQTRVVVPQGLNLEVRSTLGAGEIRVFDRTVNGTQNTLNYPASNASAAKLTLKINQSIGNVEVIRQ